MPAAPLSATFAGRGDSVRTDGDGVLCVGLGTLSLVLLIADLLVPITGVSALLSTFLWLKFFKDDGEMGCVFGDNLHRLNNAKTWVWFTMPVGSFAVALTVKEVWMKSKTTAFVINLIAAGMYLSYVTCYTVLNVAMVYSFLCRLPQCTR